jgi:hypothetical protein
MLNAVEHGVEWLGKHGWAPMGIREGLRCRPTPRRPAYNSAIVIGARTTLRSRVMAVTARYDSEEAGRVGQERASLGKPNHLTTLATCPGATQ